jgi:crotonobetainyl-CoA:carnitine CoA-transferase CaiB-like acyl-CoA transferase
MMNETTSEFRPLRGIRVLELAQNLAGPYCAQILADLGADVVKVERPGTGDAARLWGPPFIEGVGSIFAVANRGKRSVALEPGTAAGRDAVRALIEESDVLIEAFRPGAFAAMGYDYETVSGWNPRLLYCSVLAYGETGPLAGLPGYDPLVQAHGGLMSVTGSAGGGAARVGTSVVDMGTGMWLAIAVLAALRERDSTGRGTRLSVSLYDTTLAWNSYHLAGYVETGHVPQPMGSELGMICPYGAFPTADGTLMIAAANDRLFRRLCSALGLDDVAHDPAFRDNPARVANRERLRGVLGRATSALSTAALLDVLRAAGVPCAPIQDMADVARDPQTQASGMLEREGGATTVLPIRRAGMRNSAGARPPRLGEHTDEVLGQTGGGDRD